MFTLAHLSDPHLGPLPRTRPGELAGKRFIGFLNWQRRRRHEHRADVLATVVADVQHAAPDHVAVTGDIVNLALAAEFAPARGFLASLGEPDAVTLVPGNHDAYVRAGIGHSQQHWGDYMRGDGASPEQPPRFPFVRRRGAVALVGLSTAVPSPPFWATGRLGAAQLEGLAACLAGLNQERAFRIVLIHHPPVDIDGFRFRLVDAGALRQVLRRHGAELVLHGHSHVRSLLWLDGPQRRIPAVGVPSASSAALPERERAAYNLYRIENDRDGWRCTMTSRGLAAGQGGIVELETRELSG